MGKIRQGADRRGYALGHCAWTGPRKRAAIGASEGEGGADASWCCLGAKSAAGAEVERGDGTTIVAEKDIQRFKTDADGVAEVPIVNVGPYLLVIDHKVTPSRSPEQANADMFNATLWFTSPKQ